MRTRKVSAIALRLAMFKSRGSPAVGRRGGDTTTKGKDRPCYALSDNEMERLQSKIPSLLLIAIVAASTLGCAAAIEKKGYLEQGSYPAHTDCSRIAIKKDLPFAKEQMTVVGQIEASDSGFSAHCSEKVVLDIFRKEACAQGADVIHITEEKHPNFASTCYRAEAEFVRFTDREIVESIESDSEYSEEEIAQGSEKTECLHKGIGAAGVLGGAIGGLILTGICTSGDGEESVEDN